MKGLVVSFETARRLKEAGWNAETRFAMWPANGTVLMNVSWEPDMGDMYLPAPTAQEISDQLPDGACVVNYGDKWSAFIWPGSMQREKGEVADTMAEALASLWLKLKV